ncbi:MAG: SufD family Fe-S cluster assembly protein [Candidatus Eisenbacteria bacterium]
MLTQEVQCKHGATVGPLDPAHLFYLMSRAIPREEAIRMIVAGHFGTDPARPAGCCASRSRHCSFRGSAGSRNGGRTSHDEEVRCGHHRRTDPGG